MGQNTGSTSCVQGAAIISCMHADKLAETKRVDKEKKERSDQLFIQKLITHSLSHLRAFSGPHFYRARADQRAAKDKKKEVE